MKQCLLFMVVLAGFGLQGQDRIKYKDIVWPVDSHNIFVPEKWADEPAVILDRVVRYQRYEARNQFSGKEYEVYYKIKFQNNEGAEQYRYFFIPFVPNTTLDRLDARLTKPDGRVADIDAKFFKNKRIQEDVSGFSAERFIIFEVPTVESGDQLELFWRYQGHPLPQHMYFDDYLPVVRSTYVLTHPEYDPYGYSPYLGAPKAAQKEEFFRQEYKWQMTELKARRKEEHFIPALALPHIEQAFSPTFQDDYGWPLEWWIFLRQLDRLQEDVNARYDKILEAFLQDLWRPIPPYQITARIKAVHDYFNKHLTLTKYERGINIGNDLDYGRIHPDALYLFYDDLLRRFEIPYRLVLAKERSRGALDSTLVSLDEISHAFFEFTDTTSGRSHFIIPMQWEGKYALDELPGDLLGTEAVFVGAPDEVVTVEELPTFSLERSKVHRSAIVNLNGYEEEVSYPVREQWSGAASAYWSELKFKERNPERPVWRRYMNWRDKWKDLEDRPVLIGFDGDDPAFGTEWQYRRTGAKVEWKGNTVSIVPQALLQTEQVYNGPVQRQYPLFLPYAGIEQSDVYLQFGKDMVPLTFPGYNWRLPGLMEARFSVERVDNQTYRLHFICAYFKDEYSPSEAVQMRTLWREIIRVLDVPFRMAAQ